MTDQMFTIHGEPQIVADSRKKILDEFADLEFYEDGHIYILNGNRLNSVSGIGHRFISRPFDENRQAENYARKNGRDAAYWLLQWHRNSFRATTLGTKTHEFGESLGYLRSGHPEKITERIRPQYSQEYGFLAPIHPKEEAVVNFFNNMPDSYHLVLNETKVYSGKNPDPALNLKEQICGTFDMLYYYDGEGDESKAGFIILDYKTNGNLYNDFNRKKDIKLLPPFNDIFEESLGEYTIQLSLYALMLQDIGINVIDRRLVWLKDDASYEIIPLQDVSDRLRKVL